MHRQLIILTPAFAEHESDSKLPAQEILVRTINRIFPDIQITILTFHFPVRRQAEYFWHGNKVISFSGAMKGKLHSLVLWRRVWKKLHVLKNHGNLTGIFSFFCSECAFVGHYFSRKYEIRHRIWVLGQDAKKENKQVRRIKPIPEELVTISDFLSETFKYNHGIVPAHTIPIGIDTALFTHGPKGKERVIDIMGAGSLIPLKQYDVFVDVVALIAREIPGIQVRLLGNGPEEAAIRSKVRSSGLEKCIRLTGKVSQAETIETMQQCRIFLHTSVYEGLGMVCLEALYSGAHVISFCKPFNQAIPHWHIVSDKKAMAAKAIALLLSSQTDHTPVLPFNMEDTARAIIALFDR